MYIVRVKDKHSPIEIDETIEKILAIEPNIEVLTFVVDDYEIVDEDSKIVFEIFSKEQLRAPLIIDYNIAEHFPMLLFMQISVTVFEYPMKNAEKFSEFNAIQHSSFIHYKNYTKIENKLMQLVDHEEYLVDANDIVKIVKKYHAEHQKFPTPFLTRKNIFELDGNDEELINAIQSRHTIQRKYGDKIPSIDCKKFKLTNVHKYSENQNNSNVTASSIIKRQKRL